MRMAEVYLLAAEAEQRLGNGTKNFGPQISECTRKRAARE